MEKTPQSEIAARTAKLQQKMQKMNIDGALILLVSDLFYFTGTVQNAYLYVPVVGEPIFMVKRSLRRSQKESPLNRQVAIKSPRQIPDILTSFGYPVPKKIGLPLDVLPFALYQSYQKIFPQGVFCDISPAIKELRVIKSPYEIGLLRRALAVSDAAFRTVPEYLREGMTELELAARFEGELRKRGYAGCCRVRAFNQEFFYGDICSGESGSYPSYFDGPVGGVGACVSHSKGASWKKINRNEVVLIDYTTIIEGYTGDQTRIFCIGELPAKLEKAFEAALTIEKTVLQAMKPGTTPEQAYRLALKTAEELGYKDYFMGYQEDKVKFLGHGIGLELDEWPIFAKGFTSPLMPGMTFALEPKFIFPEGAIGTENSFVMTETGPEYLSITPEKITYLT